MTETASLKIDPLAPPRVRETVPDAPLRSGVALRLGVESLGEALDRRDGYGPGFDFLRFSLALSVAIFHTKLIVHAGGLSFPRFGWLLSFSVLPMFFALGGFLLAASVERLPLREFLVNRAFRIFPGLAVETVLSALLLGTLLTRLPLRDYFGDFDFYQYMLNIVGWIQFDLPGVFESNPTPGIVNGSLWTVPQDLAGYGVMALLVASALFTKRSVALVALALLAVDALLQMDPATSGFENGWVFFGTRLIAGFFCGCALYKYRYSLPCHGGIALAILAALAAVTLLGGPSWRFWVPLRELSVPPAAYLIVLLGMRPMPRLFFFRTGDYTYGIYLYAFPIQQAVTELLPHLGSDILHFAISLSLTAACAAFSWHVVEKPLLRLRRRFSFVGNHKEAAASLIAIP